MVCHSEIIRVVRLLPEMLSPATLEYVKEAGCVTRAGSPSGKARLLKAHSWSIPSRSGTKAQPEQTKPLGFVADPGW